MANKITTTCYDSSGNAYTNDEVFVKHNIDSQAYDAETQLKIRLIFSWWISQTAQASGRTQIAIVKDNTTWEKIRYFDQEITIEQAQALDPAMLQGFVTAYLESIFGAGNAPYVASE